MLSDNSYNKLLFDIAKLSKYSGGNINIGDIEDLSISEFYYFLKFYHQCYQYEEKKRLSEKDEQNKIIVEAFTQLCRILVQR